MDKRISKNCPKPENKYIALILVFLALGITLWGVIAIITGLMDGYYARLGTAIEIGDIIVLIFGIGGVFFFSIVLWFFIRCKNPTDLNDITK